MLKQAVEVLREFQADNNAELEQKDLLIIEKKPGSQQVKKIQRFGFVFGTLAPQVSPDKFKLINEILKQKGIEADLEIAVPTGGPFSNYGEIDNVFDNGKTVLAHRPGEVLLVDVWATWCPPCQQPMAHNQEMLETNPHWNGKVRIVGVSVDDDKQVVQKRVNSKNWNKVEHLTLLGWKGDHPLLKDFKIQGIPFVCLVDKSGKINYVGHPNQIDLKKRIYQLIAQGQQESAIIAKAQSVNEKEVDQFISSLSKQRVEEHFKDISLFCFRSVIKNSYQKGKIQRNGTISAYIIEGQPNASQKVQSFFGKHLGVQLKVEKVLYIEVPNTEHAQCWECCNKLQHPFYWLKWEAETKFGCRKCIEEKSHIVDHHYKYQKNSVLLLGKWDRVAAKNLGKNIQPSHPKDVERPHQFICNVCSENCKDIGKARFICLGCRQDPNFIGDYVDICENCVQKVIRDEEEVSKVMKEEGHEANHPLLRILYSTHGYYDF